MARPYWTGQIQISLVSFGVSFYVATESKSQISFHQISRSTGERVRHQKVLESTMNDRGDEGGEVVPKDEIVKGYEYSKGQYVVIEPDELDNLRVPSKHVIAVDQFIDPAELAPEYIEKPYFVAPENDAQAEPFGVVRQALMDTGKIAIGKVSFTGRENIVAIAATADGGMMAYTLRYASELRDRKDYFKGIKEVAAGKEELELAESLIKKKTAKFDPSKFVDGYEVAVKELVDAKIKHLPIPKDEVPAQRPGKVIDLMDALRKSLGSDRAAAQKKPVASEKNAARKGMRLVKPMKGTSKRKSA